jgi:hypothetical protein
VLAGAGLGDDAFLAHARGKQCLADGVVDLVRTGVVQVFALEEDLCSAYLIAQPTGVIDRTGASDVMGQIVVVFGDERRIPTGLIIGSGQLLQRPDQRFCDEAAAIAAEMAAGIRIGVEIGDRIGGHEGNRGAGRASH